MLRSPKGRGNTRNASSPTSRSRRHGALRGAIETLESRTLLTAVTYIVQGNSDTVASVVTPSGTDQYNTNTLRAAINSANNQSLPVVIEFNAAKFPGGGSNTITLASGLTLAPTGKAAPHTYTLIGPSAKPITISGANLYTDFTTGVGITAEFETLTLAHGTGPTGGAIDSNGPLTLIGDTFASNTSPGGTGGAVYNATGKLTVTNSTFTANSAQAGGGVFINDAITNVSPTISGSTFTSNTATNDGGAVANLSNVNSKLSISSTKFTGDTTGSGDLGGGAIFNFSAAGTLAMTVSSCTFSTDSTPESGGAIYSAAGKTLTLSADTFTGDKSTGAYGGAVYSLDDAATASNCTFTSDQAFEFGGGVYFASPGANPSLTITTCVFTSDQTLDNTDSDGFGGAICNNGGDNSTFTITGSTFTNDKAAAYGGAVFSEGGSSSVLTVNADTFTGASATTGDGGALDSYDQTLTVTGSTFKNDTDAADYGGGLNTWALSFTAANDTFTDDSAYAGGGGIEFFGAGTGTASTNTDDAVVPFITPTDGSASISNSTFTGDATIIGSGAGVQSSSSELDLTNSTFTGNQSGGYGGGLDSSDIVLVVDTVKFASNIGTYDGGAIHYTGPSGDATVSNSSFTDNSAPNNTEGGAFYGSPDVASLDVANDTFNGNSSGFDGGAITYFGSELSVSSSSFDNNSTDSNGGGAIITDAGTFFLTNTTFDANSATSGGGGAVSYSGSGNASIANDTFYANSASGNVVGGGGLYLNSSGTVTVTDSTLDHNSAGLNLGGGIQNDPAGGDVILDGNIIAQNYVVGTPNTASDLSGAFDVASADNLIGQGSGQTGLTNGTAGNVLGTNLSPINPMLGALANNGGPTETQIPAAGSLAIGANQNWTVIDADGNDVTANDQTGLNARPETQGYDIGAYQTGGTAVVTPTVSISTPATVHLPATGTTTIQVPVTLSSAANSAIVLTYSTIGGTATSGHGDYSGVTNATVTIPAGSPAGTYYITISNAKRETTNGSYPKTFQVKLSAATNATVSGGTETVTVTLAYP